jgi:peptide chain release factor 1
MPGLKSNLLATLKATAERFDQLTAQMNDPAVASDPARIVAAAKEHARLKTLVGPFRRYSRLLEQVNQDRAILDDPASDAALKELAGGEVQHLSRQAESLEEEIQNLLVMPEEARANSILLEIRAGTGGEEAALFAADLLNMYARYAERKGWKLEMLSASRTDLGGFREVIANVSGPGVYQYLAYEGGAHRVQRVPRTESQGRIHTSAATVAVLPEVNEIEVNIDWDKDVVEHVSRAGGPGGQNVNKVASAIKLEHLPTGITVSMRDDKSQHKNRAKARRILASRVYEHLRARQAADEAATRRKMIGSGDRSERIRTYNFPQNRCTDHRLKGRSSGEEGANFNLQQVLSGELDDILSRLLALDRAQRLATL